MGSCLYQFGHVFLSVQNCRINKIKSYYNVTKMSDHALKLTIHKINLILKFDYETQWKFAIARNKPSYESINSPNCL